MSIFGPCEYLEQHGHHDYVVDEESSDDSVIIRICRCCADVDVDPVEADALFMDDDEDYDPPEEETTRPDPSNMVKGKYKCPNCKKDFDHIYKVQTQTKQPFTSVFVFEGLNAYATIIAQKTLLCHHGDWVHFRFDYSGEERLVQMTDYHPEAYEKARQYWDENRQPCEEEGCDKEGIPCYLEPENLEPTEWRCEDHAYANGYCWGCGYFQAGTEFFDFNPHQLCASCQQMFDDEQGDDDDYDDDEWAGYDEYDPPYAYPEV